MKSKLTMVLNLLINSNHMEHSVDFIKLIICIGHILYLEKNLYCNSFLNISVETFYFYFLFHKGITL